MHRVAKKIAIGLSAAVLCICGNAAEYPSTGTSTEPNVWTKNYSGVLQASQKTGYPILLIIITDGCSHCARLMSLTVNTSAFAAMDSDLTFYKVLLNGNTTSGYSILMNHYLSYFNNKMYPLAAVLRKDGSVYGSFGNATTDYRNVTEDLRQLITRLSAIQIGSGVVEEEVVPVLSAAEWAAKLKGKANGVVFDDDLEIAGSFAMSVNAKGKVSVKFTTAGGKTTLKGMLTAADNVPKISSGSLTLSYDSTNEVWAGSWDGYGVYASRDSGSSYSGLYTSSATNGTDSGYITLTVKSGKGKFAGLVGGKNKVSANGAAVVLPAAFVAENLVGWDVGADLAFVPMVKAGKFSGGAAVAKGGRMALSFVAFGSSWSGTGAVWSKSTDLTELDGSLLRITTSAGAQEIPVRAVNAKRIKTGVTDVSATLSAAVKKGTFKGSVKIDGSKYKFEGALIRDGGAITGCGVSFGAGVCPVNISRVQEEEKTQEDVVQKETVTTEKTETAEATKGDLL